MTFDIPSFLVGVLVALFVIFVFYVASLFRVLYWQKKFDVEYEAQMKAFKDHMDDREGRK